MFSDPKKIVEQCGVQAGQEIADFGAGSGFYATAFAKALISTGRVYVIDVQKDLLTKLKNNANRDGIYNIEVILGDVEKVKGSKLKDSCVDLVCLCNLMFQVEDRQAVIVEAKRILKPHGRVLVVDWEDSFGGIGPKQESVIKKDDMMDMFEKFGFHLDREVLAGEHHYGMIYKKL